MKVAIVAPSPVPFLIGGAEKFFLGLVNNINQLSHHDAELIKVPCKDWEFWSLMDCYRKFSELELEHFDAVITTKYPAWMIRHKHHIVYMQHTCRGVYDLYHLSGKPKDWTPLIRNEKELARLGEILNSKPTREKAQELLNYLKELEGKKDKFAPELFEFPGPLTRAIIRFLDQAALSPEGEFGIKSYFAISKNVATREGYFPKGVKVGVVYHPSNLEGFRSADYKYIFTASRLESLKRIDLLIEAFKSLDSDIQFLIAGTGGQEEHLKKLARDDERIKFLGFVTDTELLEYYSNALFVPFIPYDEDYGLITLEAMKSEKAVLTTYDSGGVTELVKDKYNGLIVEPRVKSLSRAMERLIKNKEETIKMGKLAQKSVRLITWKQVVETILDNEPSKRNIYVNIGKRPELLVLSTFPIYPPISGGKKRIYHLYKNLTESFKITILSLNHESKKIPLAEDFNELRIKRTPAFNELANQVASATGVSSDDIAAIEGYKLIPEFQESLEKLLKTSSGVILSHPYLFFSVSNAALPLFYDAHNLEYKLKKDMFSNSYYLNKVKEVERRACQESELVYAVSEEDAQGFITTYQTPEDKIIIIENGVNASEIKPLPPKEKKALKARLGLENKPVALFVGSKHKPNEEALNIVKNLANSFKDVIFIVVGEAGDNLEGSPSNLITTGIIAEEEKDVIMKASDIGLNPMMSGAGTNLKLLEYMAYKLLVVSTNFGARGINFKGDEILSCRPDALESTFELALKILKDEEQLNSITSKARKLAEKYDWSVLAKKLEKKLSTFLTS